MYKEQPYVEKPKNENARIWRYMDFTKFVNLLDRSALFFARADKLGDPFEGSCSKASIETRKEFFKRMKLIKDDTESKSVSDFYGLLRQAAVVNCWNLSIYESAALWRLYLKSNEGIAIRSTFKRLRESLWKEKQDIFIGKVQYINYVKDMIPEGFIPQFFCKRKSFKHERELRAVILMLPKRVFSGRFTEGMYVPVDLNMLIKCIYLAPTSPKWLHELVESVIGKYGLDKKVVQSSLDDVPVY